MLCRPFRAVFALIISYGDFDLPQNLFIDLADRRAEGCHRARGVEIKDAEKILVFKVILRPHPAAGHEGVGDADRRGVFERHLDVVIIILLQVCAGIVSLWFLRWKPQSRNELAAVCGCRFRLLLSSFRLCFPPTLRFACVCCTVGVLLYGMGV